MSEKQVMQAFTPEWCAKVGREISHPEYIELTESEGYEPPAGTPDDEIGIAFEARSKTTHKVVAGKYFAIPESALIAAQNTLADLRDAALASGGAMDVEYENGDTLHVEARNDAND